MSRKIRSTIGRPKQDATELALKRQRIIDAAFRLFNDQGYEAISMRKIALEAGMGAMTIYQYFSNKIEILHHIWAHHFEELFQKIDSKLALIKDDKQIIRIAAQSYLEYWLSHPDRFRVVFLNEDRSDTKDNFFIDQTNIAPALIQYILPAIEKIFPENDMNSHLLFIQGLICYLNGMALNLITISEFSWSSQEALLNHYLDTILR